MKITHLLFTDIETTALAGPKANTDAIIEIAAASVNLATRGIRPIVNTLIRPSGRQTIPVFGLGNDNITGREWDLGKFHTDGGHFNGVTQAQWNEAPELHTVLQGLVQPFTGATFAGQNPGFDLRYIRRDFALCGIDFPEVDYHQIDTVSASLFLAMLGKVDGLSLRYTRKWAQCGAPQQGHRSWSDVLDAIQVFFAMFDFFTAGIEPDAGHEPAFTFDWEKS